MKKDVNDGKEWFSWGLGWKLKWSRVAKYKQRRQLFSRVGMDKHTKLKAGACTALSTSWIMSHKCNPLQKPKDRVESFNSDVDFINHNITAEAFNSSPGEDIDEADKWAKRIKYFAVAVMKANEAEVGLRTKKIPYPLLDFDQAIKFLDVKKGYFFLMMPITNNSTSHVCALYAGSEKMDFFDPNFGEFEIKKSDRQAFFFNLGKQYETFIHSKSVKASEGVKKVEGIVGGTVKVLEFKAGWVLVGV